MSSTGRLVSFEAATGKKLLDINTLERFKGQQIQWCIAESVLIDGDKVICTPGGPEAAIVALNKTTGETVWTTKGLGEPSAYCSANLIRLASRRIIVTQFRESVVGVDADSGALLWRHPVRHGGMGIKAITPLFGEGRLCVTGVLDGSTMLELAPDGSGVTPRWNEKTLNAQYQGTVLVDGHVYGTGFAQKALVCLELATGKVNWTAKETGMGTVVYADGMLYVYSESGTMRLIKADLSAFAQVSTFQVTQGTGEHWANPTIANRRLYLRHGDALMVYDLAAD